MDKRLGQMRDPEALAGHVGDLHLGVSPGAFVGQQAQHAAHPADGPAAGVHLGPGVVIEHLRGGVGRGRRAGQGLQRRAEEGRGLGDVQQRLPQRAQGGIAGLQPVAAVKRAAERTNTGTSTLRRRAGER